MINVWLWICTRLCLWLESFLCVHCVFYTAVTHSCQSGHAVISSCSKWSIQIFYQCIVVPVHITFPLWTTFMFVVQLSSQNLLLNDLSPDFIYLWYSFCFLSDENKTCLFWKCIYIDCSFWKGKKKGGGGRLPRRPLLCQPLFWYFLCISCLFFVFNYSLLCHIETTSIVSGHTHLLFLSMCNCTSFGYLSHFSQHESYQIRGLRKIIRALKCGCGQQSNASRFRVRLKWQ